MKLYGRILNSVLLGQVIKYIDVCTTMLNDLNGVDEQNLAAIATPLNTAKMAALNVKAHYLMGNQASKVKGFYNYENGHES